MKQYSIFISHSWAYGENYNRLIKMLNNDPYFHFKDYSVPKHDPIHNAPNQLLLKQAIANQIRFCDVVIILAGVYSTYSKWINIEIDIAKNGFQYPKSILAIEPWASEKTSQIVKKNADKIVRWQTCSIVDAIKGLA
ncbi:MAG: TIR domain-containing protein [Parcubacteria group bacterium]|jgi:hypothetical protein